MNSTHAIIQESFDINKVEEYSDIKLTDSLDDLRIYCYTTCNEESPEFVKNCRGVVVNEGGNVVLKTFGYTPEFVVEDENLEQIKSWIKDDFEKCKFYDSEEGCLLRLFNHNGKWLLITHRKLDAYKSRWSSEESFGEIFEKGLMNEYCSNKSLRDQLGDGFSNSKGVLERFYETLDTSRCYMFVVKNTTENRIVCDAPDTHTVYYSGSLNKNGTDFSMDRTNVTRPIERTFSDVDDLCKYVASADYKKIQGVFVYNSNTGKTCKLVNSEYNDFFNTRGNEPNIKFRYLQVRNHVTHKKRIFELYPEWIPVFDKCEQELYQIGEYLYDAYVRRFIYKEFCMVPSEQYTVIRQCHEWHISDRANNKITLNKVLAIIDEQPGHVLNRMMKAHASKFNQN